MVQRLAHELDMAGLAVEQAGNGVQSGGLAGADLVFMPIYYQPASIILAQAKAMGLSLIHI